MYQLGYTIRTLAPVIVSSNSGEINTVNTERYIPGTTVLGMLAWRYLKQEKLSSDASFKENGYFNRFFIEGGIIFTNGFITRKNKYEEDVTYYPPPISYRMSKTNENEIYNTLFLDEDFDEQTRTLEAFVSTEEEKWTQPSLELHHHHERDRVSGSPVKGQLFTYEAVSPDQLFFGKLLGEEKDLQTLLNTCKRKWIGWVGRSRNSQYGKVKFVFDTIAPFETAHIASIAEDNKIVMTMLSHTLIYNKCGFPSTDIGDLEQCLCGARIKSTAIKSKIVENFVGVWGFRKPAEIAFHSGASFLLDIEQVDWKKLSELTYTGIGERTHEGFGQIKLETLPKEPEPFYLTPYNSPQSEKPEISLPDRTRSIVKNIVMNEIHNRTRILAAEELEGFPDNKLPKGSLVARLENCLNYRKNNMTQFSEDIKKLKGLATYQLERCCSKERTLKSLLLDKHDALKMNTILNQENMEPISKICDEIEYRPECSSDVLKYIYLETFLALMSKRIKSYQKER